MLIKVSQSPQWNHQIASFVRSNPKDSSFTHMNDKEKQHILTINNQNSCRFMSFLQVFISSEKRERRVFQVHRAAATATPLSEPTMLRTGATHSGAAPTKSLQ